MKLSKDFIDVEIQTNEQETKLDFWGNDMKLPPVTLGKTARISFIRDRDGNWIEISRRASLTGDLS